MLLIHSPLSKTDLIDHNIVVLDDSLGALGEVVLNGVNHTVEELYYKERGHFSHTDCHEEYVCPEKHHQDEICMSSLYHNIPVY